MPDSRAAPMARHLVVFLAVLGALALPCAAQAAPLTWSAGVDIDGTTALTSVSCPSASLCVAMDSANPSNVLTSTNPTGGATAWTADPIGVSGFSSIGAVSCPATTLCVAVDGAGIVYWSTDP